MEKIELQNQHFNDKNIFKDNSLDSSAFLEESLFDRTTGSGSFKFPELESEIKPIPFSSIELNNEFSLFPPTNLANEQGDRGTLDINGNSIEVEQASASSDESNYALQMNAGDSITHNRFVVPDWGVLRFDLHVPELTDGTVTASMQSDVPGFEDYTLGTINLTAAEEAEKIDASYLEDRYKIGYGTQGFETFHLDIPNQLRGKVATLTFEVDGGTVYLDDVFFQSKHLLMGNPSKARYTPENPDAYANNYLLEKPQYTISYNNSTKEANWASYQLNNTWLGSFNDRPRFLPDPLLPFSNPILDENYKGSRFNRGHLTDAAARSRNIKDYNTTYFLSNVLPQAPKMNSEVWAALEDYLSDLAREDNREIYVITGGRGRLNDDPLWVDLIGNDPLVQAGIQIPSDFWKVAIVLEKPGLSPNSLSDTAGGGIVDLIAVDIPNDITNPTLESKNWTQWKQPVDSIEQWTGLDFLSNLPDEVENRIEANKDFQAL
jgi:DNA/RNA endonuclease G (NUC1)